MALQSDQENLPFDVVIGLEVHIQLDTTTKLFCGCLNAFGELANEQTCPVCLGMPGVLPVLNSAAVDGAVAMALAIGAEIRNRSVFARKQYFYPDLPKGYQITQYDLPYCYGGFVELGGGRKIEVERIHIEEDAGKNTHGSSASYVDLNRAGTPLLEMVSKPVINSPAEAADYLRRVRSIVRFLGISDGNMEEGSFRCDANISLKPRGSSVLGTRAEVKNVNSFKNVERALTYEIYRQSDILMAGGRVEQQTLRFDAESGKTIPSRSKEQTADYRYFPDPDLGPLYISQSRIEKIRNELPELPDVIRSRFLKSYSLTDEDAKTLTEEKEIALYFDELVSFLREVKPKLAANFVLSEMLREVKLGQFSLNPPSILPFELAELLNSVGSGLISGKIAKSVFSEMILTGKSGLEIIKSKGLTQVSDEGEISAIVDQVIADSKTQVHAYLSGKDKILGYFVGQVMKKSGGRFNPGLVNKILVSKLNDKKESNIPPV